MVATGNFDQNFPIPAGRLEASQEANAGEGGLRAHTDHCAQPIETRLKHGAKAAPNETRCQEAESVFSLSQGQSPVSLPGRQDVDALCPFSRIIINVVRILAFSPFTRPNGVRSALVTLHQIVKRAGGRSGFWPVFWEVPDAVWWCHDVALRAVGVFRW